MDESDAVLVDDVLVERPVRQTAPGMACSRAMQEHLPTMLMYPYPLRFLFTERTRAAVHQFSHLPRHQRRLLSTRPVAALPGVSAGRLLSPDSANPSLLRAAATSMGAARQRSA